VHRFWGTVMCALLWAGPVLAEEVKTETAVIPAEQAGISAEDLEIIRDLEIFEHWDDVQNEQALETENTTEEATTGDGYDQQG
jgi:hypothetical protein